MNKLIYLIIFLAGITVSNAQSDSIIVKTKNCNRAKSKITITLENHTAKELLRVNPMSPLNLFKSVNGQWVQVAQIGYCSCGMFQCPPPPELIPFGINEVLSFDWDQMESRCTDREKGTKEFKWAGKGNYKVVFEFKKRKIWRCLPC